MQVGLFWPCFCCELMTERLASSVMRSLQYHLRNSDEVRAALGTRIKLEEPWYGESRSLYTLLVLTKVLGDPWIEGKVNTMQGRVDLKFRVKGSNGEQIVAREAWS